MGELQSLAASEDLEYLKLVFGPFIKYIMDRAKTYGLPAKYIPDLAVLLAFAISFGFLFAGHGTILSSVVYGIGIGFFAIGFNSGSEHWRKRNGNGE